MNEFHGFMFSKLHLIGSKSEGPTYFLQQFDYGEIPVEKKAALWQEDPALQKHLASKVTIGGELTAGRIRYEKVLPYSRPPTTQPTKGAEASLKIDLKLETQELWLNKMPPSPAAKPFPFALEVEWPYRSIWQGLCPTSQLYDFFVEHDGQLVWRWSQDRFFLQVLTPVFIPGGSPIAFPETWIVEPEKIEHEGTYSLRGIFIASRQEVMKEFQIKFAH
jgi:hypothetical protein